MSSGPVLIVEDNIDILEAMQMAIEMEEVQVLTATNGQEALALLEQGQKPSLILLDLMMPIMDGWTFAEVVSQSEDFSQIPIVIVSAFSDQKQFPPNAVLALSKPVNFGLLISTVKKYSNNDITA